MNKLNLHWDGKSKSQKIKGEFKASLDEFYEHSDDDIEVEDVSVGEVIQEETSRIKEEHNPNYLAVD